MKKLKIWWFIVVTNYYEKLFMEIDNEVLRRNAKNIDALNFHEELLKFPTPFSIKFKGNFFNTLTIIEEIIKRFKKRDIFEKCDSICEIKDVLVKVKKNRKKLFIPAVKSNPDYEKIMKEIHKIKQEVPNYNATDNEYWNRRDYEDVDSPPENQKP